jgi:hypothetical protein
MSPPAHRPNRAWLLLPAGLSLLPASTWRTTCIRESLADVPDISAWTLGWARPMRCSGAHRS